jgi:hypothetical protein
MFSTLVSEKRACEIMWKNMVEAGRQATHGNILSSRKDVLCLPDN